MAQKLKLHLPPQFNFHLIVLVSTEPIYRLAWLINTALDIELVVAPKLKIYDSKSQKMQHFDCFRWTTEAGDALELVQNKGEHGVLLEEQAQIDYLLKIPDDYCLPKDAVAPLKQMKEISLAVQLQPDRLKSKNKLLFSAEED